MENKKQMNLTHQGWEDYYITTERSAWKEEPEDFLVENFSLLAPSGKHLLVLDIACGDGRNTSIWTNNGNVVCCNDISSAALKKIQELKLNNQPVLLSGDFLQLNLLTEQFDIIQCFDGLPQMPEIEKVIKRMVDLIKLGGKIVFNIFTPNDVAFGEGERINRNSFLYKDTLFSFFELKEILDMIPRNTKVEKYEIRRWQDPPHGEFRPYSHTHEAIFFILTKINI